MDSFNVLSFFADVKPKLFVFQAVITYPYSCGNGSFQVKACNNLLDITVSNGKVQNGATRFQFSGISFSPVTLNDLQPSSDHELCLRLALKEVIQEEFGGKFLSADNCDSDIEAMQSTPFCYRCRMCGSIILDQQLLGRVLPLPSDSWLDGSEAWWCHFNCHPTYSSSKPPAVKTLSPRPRDCLVGDSCIIVQFSSLVEESCRLDAGNKVLCSRCRYELGRPIASVCSTNSEESSANVTVRLSTYAVSRSKTRTTESWEFRPEEIEMEIAACLLRECNEFNHFRFVFETHGEGRSVKPVIVVWIMEADCLIYACQGSLPLPGVNECQLSVSPTSAVKVLYKNCLLSDDNRAVGQSWYKDQTVTAMELPEPICLNLLHCLAENMSSLPPSLQRAGDGFCVGFLRKSMKLT